MELKPGQHHAKSIHFDNTEFRASFWRDDRQPIIHSIIAINTGCAHLHIQATSADLRALALLLVDQAEALDRATAELKQE